MKRLGGAWRERLRSGGDTFGLDVLLSMGSLVVLAVSGILINLIITLARGTEGLGVFNQVYALYITLSQINTAGLQFSTLRYVSYVSDDRDRCADITTSALVLITLFSLPVLAVGFLAGGLIEDYFDSAAVAEGFRLVLPGLLFFGLNKALINALNGLQRMKAYALFRTLRFVVLPLAVSGILLLDYDNATLPFALTLTEGLLFVALSGYIYTRLLPLKPIAHLGTHLREHLSFGLRSMLSGALLELNTRVDVIILGYFTTDARVGVYSFAAMLAEGFAQFPVAIRWNIDPILGQHFARNAIDDIGALVARMRRQIVLGIGALGLVAVIAYPLGYWLLLGSDHLQASWAIFAIIAAGVVINAPYAAFKGVLLQGGYPGLFTALTFLSFLGDTLMNLVAIPALEIYGAAIVTCITFVLDALYLRLAARRLFGLRL